MPTNLCTFQLYYNFTHRNVH